MAETFNLPGNVVVGGQLSAKVTKLSPGCVDNTAVSLTNPIEAIKLQHQHQPLYATGSGVTAAAATQALHVVRGANATLLEFFAGVVGACVGDSTITVDLKHNGVSVLASAITLSSSHAARQVVSATISTTDFGDDDMLEVVVTVSAGGGTLGTGVFAGAVIREDA